MFDERVLTVDEVAKYLRVPIDAIEGEVASGRMSAINVAGHLRIREYALTDYMNHARTKAEPLPASALSGFKVDLHSAADFIHRWPDGTSETFKEVAEGVASYEYVDYQVKVGFTLREAAGRLRARGLVLINRYPSVEFVGEDDDLSPDTKLASIIKDRNGKQLPVGAEIPPEYVGKTIEPYRSVVDGPGARNGLAIVCEVRDLNSMVEHGVIRYRYRDERE
jgi:excisionase family DNA binding protein